MGNLDNLLQAYIDDANKETAYYEEVLKTDFCVPVSQASQDEIDREGGVAPLLLEADDKTYMMLFDSVERLAAWAKKDRPYATLSGAAIAQFTPAGLYWAINMGCEYVKEMSPDEIAYLKQICVSGAV